VEYFFGLEKNPDAVFAAEDFSALGVIKGLKERKVLMPKDFGVIGFANESFGEHISPSLSTVDQQTVEMGKKAFGLLVDIISGKGVKESGKKFDNIILEPILYDRESTAIQQTELQNKYNQGFSNHKKTSNSMMYES
jgi:LacI family transcriptional regulator